MRKTILLFITLTFSILINAQIITTNPAFVSNDYSGVIAITFDASFGTGGLNNYTGDVYAHTGVITDQSTSDSDWRHTPTWGDNSPKYKLTPLGNNRWQLLITPSISAYYGLEQGETVRKLAFVFRSADKTKEGKDTGGRDIFVTVYESGLNVKFDNPSGNILTDLGATINFVTSSSISANLTLKINGEIKQTATAATALNFSHTFSTAGDYECIILATANAQTAGDTINICVLNTCTVENLPAGIQAGINYYSTDPTKVTLVLYAKDKNATLPDNVLVVGDFNNWTYSNTYQMKRDGFTGNWWLTLENLIPQQEYAFQYAVKTGNKVVKISDAYTEKVLDPWNDNYISPAIYPDLKLYPAGKTDGLVSVLQTDKPNFRWSQQTLNFQPADKNNLIIYELWIHDYSTYHSVNEVCNRLNYLQSLGVNALELMPIVEFDGNISWGYNPNHYFAPDKAYGTPNAYKTLIDECHKRGIAVIVDMVFNHATGNNPFAKLYWNDATNNVSVNNPWFNVIAPHDASVFHDFNHDFEGTKNYFKRVLQYWINEYKIDGYRMDLTKGICGENCNNRVAIINEYYEAVKAAKNDAYFILEHWTGSEEQGFVDAGMLCWGGGEAMNNAYSQTAMGWLRNGDNLSAASKKGWVYFAESHDEERNFYKVKIYGNGNLKTDEAARIERVPLNVAFNVLLQGPKMLWQFEELGFDFSINSGGGRTNPKPVPDELDWFSNELRMSAFNKVAKMIQLRTTLKPEIFLNGTTSINVGSGVSLRTVQWEHNGTKIMAVGNFNVSGGTEFSGAKPYSMPSGTWYNYLNNNAVQNGNTTTVLQPGELCIFTNDNTIVAPANCTFDFTAGSPAVPQKKGFYIYPTLVNNHIYIQSDETVRSVQVVSLRGGAARIYHNKTEIDLSSYTYGMYLVVVTTDKSQYAQKIIKQ